jgi:thymidylate synthase
MNFKNANEAFRGLYFDIMQNGVDFSKTKTKFNVSFTLDNPLQMVITEPERKFNQSYAEYEWHWYLSGNRDVTEIAKRAKLWNNMIVPGTNEVNSNYGYFWQKGGQLERAIQELKSNPNTRRAIIVHYDINELDRYASDTPCNIVLNFTIVEGRLNLTVFARSIDLVYGFSNDQYTFAKLMSMVCFETNTQIGTMHFFITNLHIYEKHFNMLTPDVKTSISDLILSSPPVPQEEYQCKTEDYYDFAEPVPINEEEKNSGSSSVYLIKDKEKKSKANITLDENGWNPIALECLDYYIDINRKTEKVFIDTRKREFNTGDNYIDNVNLFHNIDRRYEGFIFLLEDYFMGKESLTWDIYKPIANPNWEIYDYLFLIYSHRIFGSGTSNQFNHGYNNTILLNFQNYNSHVDFYKFMKEDKGNFVSCCVNQPPRYPLKDLVINHFRPWADHIIENIKPKTSLCGIVDVMNQYNSKHNLHAFNFHYLLMAGDLANYVNLDTKIKGLFDIDEWSECKLGPTATASMKILRPGFKYKDFDKLCARYNMKPVDLEDLLCVWLKYIKNPIWQYYIKQEHTIKDFDNGWNIPGVEKHKSYFKFKSILESK